MRQLNCCEEEAALIDPILQALMPVIQPQWDLVAFERCRSMYIDWLRRRGRDDDAFIAQVMTPVSGRFISEVADDAFNRIVRIWHAPLPKKGRSKHLYKNRSNAQAVLWWEPRKLKLTNYLADSTISFTEYRTGHAPHGALAAEKLMDTILERSA